MNNNGTPDLRDSA